MTEAEALEKYDIAITEEGWLPFNLRDLSCSCHINPPCGKCCFDFDAYFDEWLEENGIEIKE